MLLAPTVSLLSLFTLPLALSVVQSAPQETVKAVGPAELVAAVLETLAVSSEEGAWKEHESPQEHGHIVLAFLADGHSVTRGDHRDLMREATKRLVAPIQRDGTIGEAGPAGDLGHALTLCAVAELALFDPHPSLLRRVKNAAGGASARANDKGLWGTEGAAVRTTARMVTALRAAHACGGISGVLDTSGAARALASLVDPETGILAGADLSKPDGLADQSALVVTLLFAGGGPSADELLAKSMAALSKGLAKPDAFARVADPEFWEWTTYALVQIDGPSDRTRAWNRAAFRALGPGAADMTPLGGAKTAPDARRLAGTVRALAAVWRHPRVLEEDR